MLLAAVLAACAGDSSRTSATTSTSSTTQPPETTSTTELPITAGRQLTTYVPDIGDCFDKRRPEGKPDPLTGKVKEAPADEIVLRLDCKLPHTFEVFGTIDIKEKDFPGESTLTALAKFECPKRFADYVGKPYETSKLEIAFYLPSAKTWPTVGKKVIGCTLRETSGEKSLGSARGSAR